MQVLTPSKPQLPLFQSPSRSSKPSKPFSSITPKSHSQPLLRNPPRCSSSSVQQQSDELLVARRPEKSSSLINDEKEEEVGSLREEESDGSSGIESGLNEFAKKMPMFEPLERVEVRAEEKPLGVNLELGLYRAKVLTRQFRFKEAGEILRKCMFYWPEEGRVYVALGKILSKQSKYGEARLVYEKGCQATQGENPYIWQCWAVLENKLGNVRRARDLFDAATVADNKHVAAWHGWAMLEIKEGNIKKARNLLGKGLKYCGGNEYIYQTLAMLEAKANRVDQARYLFQRATICNPKSCASWLAWAQLEMQQENHNFSRKLFEKAVQASPKNRYAWHVWAMFEASQGDIDKSRKLLKIGHTLNPRDPVLLQSLALLEYKNSSANIARVLFKRASDIDPKHQPIWMAWGWMEWKEGNINKARELYQKALSIDSSTETAARCLQAWGVLEQRLGNLTAARRLFRSSLNTNSQSYITWMTWASLEEEEGNAIRAEEIRNLYFQQRTEIVDDASWVMGFLDIIDPAVDSIRRLLNLNQSSDLNEAVLNNLLKARQTSMPGFKENEQETSKVPSKKPDASSSDSEEADDEIVDDYPVDEIDGSKKEDPIIPASTFDLDAFIRDKLSIDVSKLDAILDAGSQKPVQFRRSNLQYRTVPTRN